MLDISVLDNKVDISPILKNVNNGVIDEMTAADWMQYGWEMVRSFMHFFPIYVLPTTELLDALEELISGYKTIEIGAGSGNIGRHLGIKMTDSYLQARKDIKEYYAALGQPVIKYPQDIIKADAITAFRRFRPECVLGCYVTHKWRPGMGDDGNMYGVDFERLLPLVKRIVIVGNKKIHSSNPIMKLPHREIDLDGGIITRNADRSSDRIFVWDNI